MRMHSVGIGEDGHKIVKILLLAIGNDFPNPIGHCSRPIIKDVDSSFFRVKHLRCNGQ
jgi:hypothetical protein